MKGEVIYKLLEQRENIDYQVLRLINIDLATVPVYVDERCAVPGSQILTDYTDFTDGIGI
ncbi:hypothetical protein [Methanocella sp. MCL-LM]|uniref:hypothetical protein n=1 Tax=Methanocella sp. MCL-LM TaxID=3412035 RepID=UPI003C735EE7